MPYYDKENLIQYLVRKHYELKNHMISPVKLQKTLYLLYAMWAGNAVNLNTEISKEVEGISEFDQKFKIDLFEPCFEAWKYGPVDRTVYKNYKSKAYDEFCTKEVVLTILDDYSVEGTIKPFVDSIASQAFEISDFSLVDLSHLDESWKRIYHMDPSGRTEMKKDDIIKEYAAKLSGESN